MFANSSDARIAYVAETNYGVTPATPAFKTLRTTGGGLRSNKTVQPSNERQADRNVRDLMLLGHDATGSLPFELSYGSFDDMIEAALQGTWTTNVLKNGSVQKSFTFEQTLELGATDSFHRFPGTTVNGLGLTINDRAEITGSFDLMAKQELLASAIVTGATYAAPGTEPPMTSSYGFASLAIGALPTPKIKTLDFSITNNLRTRTVVGSPYSEEFGRGRFEVTGNLSAYFETADLHAAVVAHGGGALSFTLGVTTLKKYIFTFPKIIFGDGEAAIGGNDEDVMENIPWTAVYDATEGCTMKVTRAVA